jgi:hypothetical protein
MSDYKTSDGQVFDSYGSAYTHQSLLNSANAAVTSYTGPKKMMVSGKLTNTYPNGDYYYGNFVDGLPCGQGRMEYKNGDVYEGEWGIKDGGSNYHGKGKKTFANGGIKEGTWQNGKYVEGSGINTAIYKQSQEELQKGCIEHKDLPKDFTGIAKVKYDDGAVYEGEYVKGKAHGKGRETFFEGDFKGNIYEGDWVNGFQTGKGKSVDTIGGIYEGDFINNEFNGKGKYIWKDGHMYEGDWVDHKQTGKGKETWKNGNTYEGDFVNGLWHGYGIYTDVEKGKVKEGKWENNIYKGKGFLGGLFGKK